MTDFHRGDLVRLKYGHTRMIVIGARSGLVKAVYTGYNLGPIERYATEWGVENTDFRNARDFMPWDGGNSHTTPKRTKRWHKQNNQTLEGENTMAQTNPTKFEVKVGMPEYSGKVGEYLMDTSKGDVVLQFDDGQVRNFNTGDVVRVTPHVFRAQALKSSYTCYYDDPNDLARCDELIVSESGNLYKVIWVGESDVRTKGEFYGSRLVTQPFA